MLTIEYKAVDPERSSPFIVMVVGVNGVGKTTTVGKLAAHLKGDSRKVMLVAADTFRPAAIEQLHVWSRRVGADFIKHKPGADPSAVVYDGVHAAISRGTDIVLVDTAGRLHTKKNLMDELKKIGIEENTLVVIMADNGPMVHNGPAGMNETLYTGGKGDYTEGGVRVPAIAWWPGVIAPGQIVGDIIHETDLFTTFARLAGATEQIPTDRIIDGVDQTSLIFNGDTFSRRDYNFIYTGNVLAALLKGRYKRHLVGALPGLSGPEFYDLYNDTREVQGKMLPMFPAKGMFNMMKVRHLMWKDNYPDKGRNRDFPLKGIKNARPETIEASKPRIDPDKVPFDPREAIMQVPEWENLDRNWGAGN